MISSWSPFCHTHCFRSAVSPAMRPPAPIHKPPRLVPCARCITSLCFERNEHCLSHLIAPKTALLIYSLVQRSHQAASTTCPAQRGNRWRSISTAPRLWASFVPPCLLSGQASWVRKTACYGHALITED